MECYLGGQYHCHVADFLFGVDDKYLARHGYVGYVVCCC